MRKTGAGGERPDSRAFEWRSLAVRSLARSAAQTTPAGLPFLDTGKIALRHLQPRTPFGGVTSRNSGPDSTLSGAFFPASVLSSRHVDRAASNLEKTDQIAVSEKVAVMISSAVSVDHEWFWQNLKRGDYWRKGARSAYAPSVPSTARTTVTEPCRRGWRREAGSRPGPRPFVRRRLPSVAAWHLTYPRATPLGRCCSSSPRSTRAASKGSTAIDTTITHWSVSQSPRVIDWWSRAGWCGERECPWSSA